MKIYTPQEFLEKLKQLAQRPAVIAEIDGEEWPGIMVMVKTVRRQEIGGKPCVVVTYREDISREEFDVILDHSHAKQLTETLGPHPLVEEWLRLN